MYAIPCSLQKYCEYRYTQMCNVHMQTKAKRGEKERGGERNSIFFIQNAMINYLSIENSEDRDTHRRKKEKKQLKRLNKLYGWLRWQQKNMIFRSFVIFLAAAAEICVRCVRFSGISFFGFCSIVAVHKSRPRDLSRFTHFIRIEIDHLRMQLDICAAASCTQFGRAYNHNSTIVIARARSSRASKCNVVVAWHETGHNGYLSTKRMSNQKSPAKHCQNGDLDLRIGVCW